jgi:hypothetical protein
MSASHKAALAAGRDEGRAVRNYLEAISRPRRPGRRRTPESISRQLAQIDDKLVGASAADRLLLIQQRRDLQAQQEQLQANSQENLGQLEGGFVRVAKSYSERKGLSYAAWREVGVPADVLRRAGISRSQK